jgi:hypothetical protein
VLLVFATVAVNVWLVLISTLADEGATVTVMGVTATAVLLLSPLPPPPQAASINARSQLDASKALPLGCARSVVTGRKSVFNSFKATSPARSACVGNGLWHLWRQKLT